MELNVAICGEKAGLKSEVVQKAVRQFADRVQNAFRCRGEAEREQTNMFDAGRIIFDYAKLSLLLTL